MPTQRKSINVLMALSPSTELDKVKEGFRILRSRPESQPDSYLYQSKIHEARTENMHFSEFFLPWHRAFILRFEKLLQAAVGDENLALPYWDWTNNRIIPAPFWEEPLKNDTRVAQPETIMRAEAVAIDKILSIPGFQDFGGQPWPHRVKGDLEGGPHDYVHGEIKGDMSQMSSPRDPIFWFHHANVDRIWAKWQETRSGTPSSQEFSRVLPALGMTVGDTLSIARLGYEYVESSHDFEIVPSEDWLRFETRALARSRSELEIAMASPESAGKRFELRFDDVRCPRVKGVEVRVFLGLPEANPTTSLDNPHYARSFFLVGMDHDAHRGSSEESEPLSLRIDITDKLRELPLREGLNVSVVVVDNDLALGLEPARTRLNRVSEHDHHHHGGRHDPGADGFGFQKVSLVVKG